MTQDELLKTIRDADVFAYPVFVLSDEEDQDGLLFDGDVNEFLLAAKRAGGHVFVSKGTLTESGFTYDMETDSGDEDEDLAETVEIDLCAIVPKLAKYREYLGKDGQFTLWFEIGTEKVVFVHAEDWWGEFVEQRDAAIEKVESDKEAAAKKAVQQKESDEIALVKNLRSLVGNPEFVKLPSQMAMKEYALEKFPDLKHVDPRRLQLEIQSLNARIQAKGLRRSAKNG